MRYGARIANFSAATYSGTWSSRTSQRRTSHIANLGFGLPGKREMFHDICHAFTRSVYFSKSTLKSVCRLYMIRRSHLQSVYRGYEVTHFVHIRPFAFWLATAWHGDTCEFCINFMRWDIISLKFNPTGAACHLTESVCTRIWKADDRSSSVIRDRQLSIVHFVWLFSRAN